MPSPMIIICQQPGSFNSSEDLIRKPPGSNFTIYKLQTAFRVYDFLKMIPSTLTMRAPMEVKVKSCCGWVVGGILWIYQQVPNTQPCLLNSSTIAHHFDQLLPILTNVLRQGDCSIIESVTMNETNDQSKFKPGLCLASDRKFLLFFLFPGQKVFISIYHPDKALASAELRKVSSDRSLLSIK